MAARPELLIDAYNVIYADAQLRPVMLRDPEQARAGFVARVLRHLPPGNTQGIIVFDAMRDPAPVTGTGRMHEESRGSLRIVYARETADTWIIRYMAAHAATRPLAVVTSDREILEAARTHGVRIVRVSEFLRTGTKRSARMERLRDTEKPSHTSAREVAERERLFEERRPEDEDDESQ